MTHTLDINGVNVPRFFYGTAWKEHATAGLVTQALEQGFRAIDTANQRKHYFEAAVGEALAASPVARDDVFLQTKYTFQRGQDHRLPYDPSAPITTQVAQSFARSLEHLRTDRIDSYVLHGPSLQQGLGPMDHEAWQAMEALHDARKTRFLGVSNVSASQLDELCRTSRIKPTFVQNRCYASRGWDADVRRVAREHGVTYQGFSLLTANMAVLRATATRQIAARLDRAPAQIVFALALRLGMLPLTGTSSATHMEQDLAAAHIDLTDADEAALTALG